jgi:hypothetical protein
MELMAKSTSDAIGLTQISPPVQARFKQSGYEPSAR